MGFFFAGGSLVGFWFDCLFPPSVASAQGLTGRTERALLAALSGAEAGCRAVPEVVQHAGVRSSPVSEGSWLFFQWVLSVCSSEGHLGSESRVSGDSGNMAEPSLSGRHCP